MNLATQHFISQVKTHIHLRLQQQNPRASQVNRQISIPKFKYKKTCTENQKLNSKPTLKSTLQLATKSIPSKQQPTKSLTMVCQKNKILTVTQHTTPTHGPQNCDWSHENNQKWKQKQNQIHIPKRKKKKAKFNQQKKKKRNHQLNNRWHINRLQNLPKRNLGFVQSEKMNWKGYIDERRGPGRPRRLHHSTLSFSASVSFWPKPQPEQIPSNYKVRTHRRLSIPVFERRTCPGCNTLYSCVIFHYVNFFLSFFSSYNYLIDGSDSKM